MVLCGRVGGDHSVVRWSACHLVEIPTCSVAGGDFIRRKYLSRGQFLPRSIHYMVGSALHGTDLRSLHHIWSFGRGNFRVSRKWSKDTPKIALVALVVGIATV